MLIGMRTMLFAATVATLAVGCAAGFQQVPGEQWQTVSATQRASLDHQCDADAVAADRELAAAQAAARAPAAKAPSGPGNVTSDARGAVVVIGKPALASGAWGEAIATHEKQKARVAAAIAREQRDAIAADAAWRRARLRAASLRREVVRAEREYARAKAVDHALLGSDTYADLGMFQGQLARAQARWYAADQDLRATRDALARANATVGADKERYAALVRTGPEAPQDRLALTHRFGPFAPVAARLHHAPIVALVGPELRK